MRLKELMSVGEMRERDLFVIMRRAVSGFSLNRYRKMNSKFEMDRSHFNAGSQAEVFCLPMPQVLLDSAFDNLLQSSGGTVTRSM